MANASEKLANSLEKLHELQVKGIVAIRSSDLSRTHRERLCGSGFLQEVMKGWYICSRPDEKTGESTAWYASYWQFCVSYLNSTKGTDWCLSPEQSIALHIENWTVPHQLLVRSSKANNNITQLPHQTTFLDVRSSLPDARNITNKNDLRIFSLPAALVSLAPESYKHRATDIRAALSIVRDASEILEILLEGGHTTIASRLSGAFRNIGRDDIADTIIQTMKSVGHNIRETDPFEYSAVFLNSERQLSPYANRIKLLWHDMAKAVIQHFPPEPGLPKNIKKYIEEIEGIYVSDAYHSLSIEGYNVSTDLILKVRNGNWNPEAIENDRQQRDAMAARGYWQAYNAVKKSIEKILTNQNSGEVIQSDHSIWYRELFAPSVTAGILRPASLAGYRNEPIYIRQSMHVPPSKEAVRDAMPTFFELLKNEKSAAVRAVLGHFIFVFIHPYVDGNGRIGRFLMNSMLASGGYPWTVIPLEKRAEYMSSLEEASVNQNIIPFTKFLAGLLQSQIRP